MSEKSKTLLVSGCSCTDKNWTSIHHPELDMSWPKWPELLGKKLNMKVENLAHSGAGNEYIYSSLLDGIEIHKPDIVIAAWSQTQRKDYKIRGRWTNMLFDNYGDIDYFLDKTFRWWYSLQEICKLKNIKLYQVQMLPLYTSNTHQDLKKAEKELVSRLIHKNIYFNKIDDNFLGYPCDERLDGYNIKEKVLKGYGEEGRPYQISQFDTHPNKKGHELIAEFLYDRLG